MDITPAPSLFRRVRRNILRRVAGNPNTPAPALPDQSVFLTPPPPPSEIDAPNRVGVAILGLIIVSGLAIPLFAIYGPQKPVVRESTAPLFWTLTSNQLGSALKPPLPASVSVAPPVGSLPISRQGTLNRTRDDLLGFLDNPTENTDGTIQAFHKGSQLLKCEFRDGICKNVQVSLLGPTPIPVATRILYELEPGGNWQDLKRAKPENDLIAWQDSNSGHFATLRYLPNLQQAALFIWDERE